MYRLEHDFCIVEENKTNEIGNRLEAVIKAIAQGGCFSCFADIGSDHAHLAVAIKKRGLAKQAVASDINTQPLLRGSEYAKSQGIDICFERSDGFLSLLSYDIDCAAVCGMGGNLIAEIIKNGGCRILDCYLVLQPMSAPEVLRAYLWDNGFCIKNEDFVIENKRVFSIFSVLHTGENTEYSYPDLYLGKVRPLTAEYKEYCKKTLAAAKKRLRGAVCEGKETCEISELVTQSERRILEIDHSLGK